MKKDQLIKIATISSFLILLTGFIVFKTGNLDSFFQEEKAVVPVLKPDSSVPMIPGDAQVAESDTPVSAPTQVLPFTPPPPADKEKAPVREVILPDSFYLDVISMSSKSAIVVDQGKWIVHLDSMLGSDSTEPEE